MSADLPAPFQRLVWSNLAAQSAEQLALAAAPLIAVLALGAGEAAAGALQAVQTLPFLIMSIPAGILADRMSRVRLMAGAEALRVLALLSVLALIACGALNLPLLGLLGFIAATGTVAYSVTAPAVVPALVAAAALPRANARIELARTTAFAAGPALGGALVGWIGGGAAFAIAAAFSAAAVALLARIPEPTPSPKSPQHPLHDLREGAAFVFGHPLLRPIFFTQFIFNTALFVIQGIYVPYAVHALGLSAAGIGITLGALGGGMVLGALLSARVMRLLPLGTVIIIGPLFGVVAALVMALTMWLPYGTLAGLSFFLMGAGPIVWVVSTTTLRQTVTPEGLLGRASAINSVAYGARPLGAGTGALIGGLFGAEVCLIVAAGGFLLQAGVILWSPVPRLTDVPGAGAIS
jgi:predicted MFS family arabinose efflux permease